MPITSKELTGISELMENEKILISKFNNYAEQTEDVALKEKYEHIAKAHQNHLDTLYQQLK